ncbi:hypothetical protein EC957_002992, partial [Mortierella hygrophila]
MSNNTQLQSTLSNTHNLPFVSDAEDSRMDEDDQQQPAWPSSRRNAQLVWLYRTMW